MRAGASRGVSYAPAMTDRPVAALRRVRPGLRVRRAIAVLIVLVALAVGVDYGAAALTESAVSREMRSQLDLADDPSVRINNFPFLTQAISRDGTGAWT